jgi:hypothetical protein
MGARSGSSKITVAEKLSLLVKSAQDILVEKVRLEPYIVKPSALQDLTIV